jgi:hypothetical protein
MYIYNAEKTNPRTAETPTMTGFKYLDVDSIKFNRTNPENPAIRLKMMCIIGNIPTPP